MRLLSFLHVALSWKVEDIVSLRLGRNARLSDYCTYGYIHRCFYISSKFHKMLYPPGQVEGYRDTSPDWRLDLCTHVSYSDGTYIAGTSCAAVWAAWLAEPEQSGEGGRYLGARGGGCDLDMIVHK